MSKSNINLSKIHHAPFDSKFELVVRNVLAYSAWKREGKHGRRYENKTKLIEIFPCYNHMILIN